MTERFVDGYDDGNNSEFYLPFGQQGHPTGAFTPEQIKELGLRLNAGIQNVEIGALDPQKFQMIPKQHFEEMRRLAKLAGGSTSMHAPLFDPAGFRRMGEGGAVWSEEHRGAVERELKDTIEKAHMADSDGNIRVNLHSSNDVMAFELEKNKEKYGEEGIKGMWVVHPETGRTGMIPTEVEFGTKAAPGELRPKPPEEKLEDYNESLWEDSRLKLRSMTHERDIFEAREKQRQEALYGPTRGRETLGLEPQRFVEIDTPEGPRKIDVHELANDYSRSRHVAQDYNKAIVENSRKLFENYLKYYEAPNREQERQKEQLRKEFSKLMSHYSHQREIEHNYEQKIRRETSKIKDPVERYKLTTKLEYERDQKIRQKLNRAPIQPDEFVDVVNSTETPRQYKPVEEFALGKTAETVSNAALHSLKVCKGDIKKAPVISLENWHPEMPFAKGESLRNLVLESRKKFAEKLQKQKGYSKQKAEIAAERLIGASWDVGHIYQLKKHGFSEEEILEETRKLLKKEKGKPVLKHVHITDNFGFSDSHLPPGMGEVPIKEMVKEMQKAGYKDKYIIEAGAYAGEFKDSPVPYTLENLNSPMYRYDQGPTWQQVRDLYTSYSPGFGEILPEMHFKSFYGAGFSTLTLPSHLGGQFPGDKSRFAGTPNV